MLEYKNYDTNLENVNDMLNTYGVATIPNILSKEECKKIRELMWDELKYITKNRFNINDSTTWKTYHDFIPLHGMLVQHWSLGHMQSVWDVRQHENVANVFSNIWNTPSNDLLSSFDGISIHLPPETTNRGYYKNNNWLHTDQAPSHIGKNCVQGIVNLFPVKQGDATLTILEKSHNYHTEFFKSINDTSTKNWRKISMEEQDFFTQKGCKQYCVEADEGSITLWDSRTIHQGIESQRDRKIPNTRMVVYVCMLPRSKSTPKELLKKQKCFNEMRITSHIPHKIKMFSKQPRMWSNPVPDLDTINPPKLTQLGRRLAGFA
jgi:hypothetical protein